MRSALIYALFAIYFAKCYGQRWVWGSRRSERQLESHRPFLRPTALPPAAAADAAPAVAAGFISPPAAPFGLVPSASSLVPHGSPPAVGKSSFSSLHGTETQVSAASFELRPRPIEPLVFRPLSIDISKLPLQSSSEVDSFDAAFLHPPLSAPSSLVREAVHQDLTRGLPLGRPGHPDRIPGVVSSNVFQRDISSVDFDIPGSISNTKAFITTPDISTLPLEGSSPDGTENFGEQAFGESPAVIGFTQFQVHSPSSDRLLFPQRISTLQAINKRHDRSFLGPNSKRETVVPKPSRIFFNGQTSTLNQSPFSKKKVSDGKKILGDELALLDAQAPRGIIRFPKEIKKFIPPAQTFRIDEPIIAGSSRDESSFILPPIPLTSSSSLVFNPLPQELQSNKPNRGSRDFFSSNRPTRQSGDFVKAVGTIPESGSRVPNQISNTPEDASKESINTSALRDFKISDNTKTLTLLFKKHFKTRKGNNEPTYVWLWPGKPEPRRISPLVFTSPAKHAL